jgi:xanthine dehydrogenase molybdenum-binding subunit
MAIIAAETLGIPLEKIQVIRHDTDICPIDMGAYASRQTYVSGNAVKKAALKCKLQIIEKAAALYHQPIHKLDTRDGFVINKDTREKIAPMSDVTLKIVYDVLEPATISHEASHFPTDNVLAFGATMAIVNVNTETGKVQIEKLVTCLDSGKIINPNAAFGQLYGGSIMSIGFGLYEQLVIDSKTGRVLNDNMLDYKIPTFADIPDIEGYFAESFEDTGAYGNKVLGEPPNLSPAAAIRNAVYDATGIMVRENPLTPERVYLALHAEDGLFALEALTTEAQLVHNRGSE